MIAKIIPSEGRTFAGVVSYNIKQDKNSELVCCENFPNEDVKDFTHYLEFAESQSRTKSPVFHVSIGFHPDEHLSKEQLAAVAQTWMERMGYGAQPYFVYEHNDVDHQHVHIISSRVDVQTFKKINDSNEKRRSAKISTDIEKEFSLRQVERNTKSHTHTQGKAERLNAAIKDVLKAHSPHNIRTLKEALKTANIGLQETEKGGVVFFLNEEGVKGKGVSASELSCFKKKSVHKQLKTNWYVRDKAKQYIKKRLETATSEGVASVEEFNAKLGQHEITATYHSNTSGVYGVSFEYNGFTFKGSEIDKSKYTWTKLNAIIGKKVAAAETKTQAKRKTQKYTGKNSRFAPFKRVTGKAKEEDEEEDEEEKKKRGKRL